MANEQYRYAVIGAGRQGSAAAYDMAKAGGAGGVLMADVDAEAAARAAGRVNELLGREAVTAAQVDVRDADALVALLKPVDVLLCATPFVFILDCTRAAIEAGTSMVDLGGHTETVLRQLEMHNAARAKPVTVVPDCGMGPGMNNTFGVYVIEQLQARGAAPREVRLWDGGLPQNPQPPWGYQCTFHINGLTNEYDGQAVFLRGGKPTPVDALTELETVEFDGIGRLEAFVTSGGTSTVPYSFAGQLQVYENKTCRYPGHFAQFRAFRDLGLFEEQPVTVASGAAAISPRELYHALLRPKIEAGHIVDVCVMRAQGVGEIDGRDITLTVDLIDYYDEATGFTAMERLTGWHAAIMAGFIARGEVAPGVWPLEKAIPATHFMEAVRGRGFTVAERWEDA